MLFVFLGLNIPYFQIYFISDVPTNPGGGDNYIGVLFW